MASDHVAATSTERSAARRARLHSEAVLPIQEHIEILCRPWAAEAQALKDNPPLLGPPPNTPSGVFACSPSGHCGRGRAVVSRNPAQRKHARTKAPCGRLDCERCARAAIAALLKWPLEMLAGEVVYTGIVPVALWPKHTRNRPELYWCVWAPGEPVPSWRVFANEALDGPCTVLRPEDVRREMVLALAVAPGSKSEVPDGMTRTMAMRRPAALVAEEKAERAAVRAANERSYLKVPRGVKIKTLDAVIIATAKAADPSLRRLTPAEATNEYGNLHPPAMPTDEAFAAWCAGLDEKLDEASASAAWRGAPGTGEHPLLAHLRATRTAQNSGGDEGGESAVLSTDLIRDKGGGESPLADGNVRPSVAIGDSQNSGPTTRDPADSDVTQLPCPIELSQYVITNVITNDDPANDDNVWPGGPAPGNDDPDPDPDPDDGPV
jgi:hypothetical protein